MGTCVQYRENVRRKEKICFVIHMCTEFFIRRQSFLQQKLSSASAPFHLEQMIFPSILQMKKSASQLSRPYHVDPVLDYLYPCGDCAWVWQYIKTLSLQRLAKKDMLAPLRVCLRLFFLVLLFAFLMEAKNFCA